MNRWGKWSALALGVVGLIAVAGRVVISQQPAPAPQPAPVDPYVQLFEQARPHLEAVLGAPLVGVQLSTASPQQLLRVPEPDLDAYLRRHFPHLQGPTLETNRQAARQIAASATACQYAEGHNVIVVAADNLEKIAAWNPALTAVNSPQFLQLALVYEAARCHLDHRYDLAKLRAACRDAEEFDALQALVEGRAFDVTRQVAARLGTESLLPLLGQRWLHVPDDAPDPSLRAASQTYLHARCRAMTAGVEFFAALDEGGLRDDVVFAHRPRQMTVIARPHIWLQMLEQHRPGLAEVLAPLAGTFPAVDWQAMEQTWTPAMLGQVAGLLGASPERAEKLASTWYEGRTLIWTLRKQPDHQVALNVVRHDGPAGARAYFGFAVDLQRRQDTLPPGNCGLTIRVVDSHSTAVKLEGFDEVVRNDKRIQLGSAEPIPVSLLLARAGDLVVECTWRGGAGDAAVAQRLLQTVRAEAK